MRVKGPAPAIKILRRSRVNYDFLMRGLRQFDCDILPAPYTGTLPCRQITTCMSACCTADGETPSKGLSSKQGAGREHATWRHPRSSFSAPSFRSYYFRAHWLPRIGAP